jgi:ectoine hydroxylase-related dioxygenase (phytanoyl-CoA dioxygenase family)
MGPQEEFESLKFAFYLDDLSRGGCLRVVPGSHLPQLHQAVSDFRTAQQPQAEMPWAHPCVTQPGDLLIFNLKLWHQGTANEAGTHRRVIFWSVGQQATNFNAWARNFNEKVGRGTEDEPWPESFIKDAPRRRLDYLRVYAPGTKKAAMLL